MRDLDSRIAEEFMGWEQKSFSKAGLPFWRTKGTADIVADHLFSPTTDMNSAYVVLEKIAGKFTSVNIFPKAPEGKFEGWAIWIPSVEDENLHLWENTLPLAISKLAEAIMNSPEHMELFK